VPTEPAPLEARFLSSITQIPSADWNRLSGIDYPFLRHEFLSALEQSGSSDADSGWQPCHLTIYRDNALIALMPLYLKSHSYGEYVFDWSWADAWRQHGLDYYPKLVTAIPFTPATGPRLCMAVEENRPQLLKAMLAAVEQFANQQQLSSWHLLFPEREDAKVLAEQGTSLRLASQFHWFNRGYSDFDDFLAGFNSRKRKNLRRERRRVAEQGISLQRREGADITSTDWENFYRFYQTTYAKRSGHGGYLNREFFQQIGTAMPEHCVMIMAYLDGAAIAGSLCFRSSDTLYGRYWGCDEELDCLHFEACYYQGIDYCIEQGLQRFDPGAQGEHKIQRGFEPVPTWSNHWISDPQFAEAIADFTRREVPHIEAYISQASGYLPFKQAQ
jgi:predicted N-acyltransferase